MYVRMFMCIFMQYMYDEACFFYILDATEQKIQRYSASARPHCARLQPIIWRIKWQLAKDLGEEFRK